MDNSKRAWKQLTISCGVLLGLAMGCQSPRIDASSVDACLAVLDGAGDDVARAQQALDSIYARGARLQTPPVVLADTLSLDESQAVLAAGCADAEGLTLDELLGS